MKSLHLLTVSLLACATLFASEEYPYIQPVAVEEAPSTQIVQPESFVEQTPQTQQEVKEEAQAIIDSDGDGIADDKDQCSQTVSGASVNEKGCEHDSDGDGVKDSADKCPNTSKDFLTDGNGCPQTATLQLNFPPNKATISDTLVQELDEFAKFLNDNKGYQVVIYGHTDSIGDADVNKKLSQKRANAVKQVLERYGIKSTRLTAIGKGEAEPIESNMYKEGRAKNRRIEVELIY